MASDANVMKLYDKLVVCVSKNDPAALQERLEAARALDADLLLRALNTVDLEVGASLLSTAASFGHTQVMRLLLEAGASAELRLKNGTCALATSGGFGHREAVELLVEKRAQVDNVDDGGMTPLMHTVWKRHVDCIATLLRLGADYTRRTASKTLLDFCATDAGEGGANYVLEALRAELGGLVEAAVEGGDLGIPQIARLLPIAAVGEAAGVKTQVLGESGEEKEEGVKQTEGDEGGKGEESLVGSRKPWHNLLELDAAREGLLGSTFLTFAAHQGSLLLVSHLLRAGASPSAPSRHGTTPLISAAANGFQKVVSALLAAGAPLDQADEGGMTPLMHASWKLRPECVATLLAAGADKERRSAGNKRALDFAELSDVKGDKEAVAALLA